MAAADEATLWSRVSSWSSSSDCIPDTFTDTETETVDDGHSHSERSLRHLIKDVAVHETGACAGSGPIRKADFNEPLQTPTHLCVTRSFVPSDRCSDQLHQPANSHSEPGPRGRRRAQRKHSISELVALRYRGGKRRSEIGAEERGLLALDLGAYINSGEPDRPPDIKPLPPSGLFPRLETLTSKPLFSSNYPTNLASNAAANQQSKPRRTLPDKLAILSSANNSVGINEEPTRVIRFDSHGLPLPTPRSEWTFSGGTGPGKTCRGFIPGCGGCDGPKESA